MATKVTKEPSPGPKNLRLSRGSDQGDGRYGTVTANWGNPASATNDSNHKWEWMNEAWTFKASKNMSKKWTEQTGSGHATADLIWVRDIGIRETSTVWYDRRAYHPHVKGRYLQSVNADIYPCNSVKGWTGSHHAKATLTMRAPAKPTITSEYDEETGRLTFTIEVPEVKGNMDRTDTIWCVVRKGSAKNDPSMSVETIVKEWSTFTTDERTYTIDLTGYQYAITNGDWITFTCKAYSRGVAGDSNVATKAFTHAYPARASITGISISDYSRMGIVMISLKTNANNAKCPVDEITLQRLADVSYSTPQGAGFASGWEDVVSDNGSCKGLTDLVADAVPGVKRHTWYRIKSKHEKYEVYSGCIEAKVLYRTKDAHHDDEVSILSVSANDATSLTMRLAWDADDSNAVEVAWSEYEDAWESTEQPSTYVVDWEDDTPETGYDGSASLTIRGLEEGKSYYIRARRAQTEDETHGPWCYPSAASYPTTVSGDPLDVQLTAPAGIARGEGMDVSWTHSGAEQTAWNVSDVDQSESSNTTPKPVDGLPHELYRYVLTSDSSVVASHGYYEIVSYTPTGTEEYTTAYQLVTNPSQASLSSYYVTSARKQVTLASGSDASGACTVPADTIGDRTGMFVVACVTCGSDWAYSNVVQVAVADPPTVAVAVATLTAQPLSIGLSTDCPTATATIVVASRGVAGDSPSGQRVQAEGDVVWSTAVTPDWEADGGLWAAAVIAPANLDLRQGGVYDVTASVTDPDSTLSSGDATASFTVNWSHEATCPSASSRIRGYVDELEATILPVAPEGAAQTDVVDVYRVTPDGAYLIAGDVPFGTEVRDLWAPYASDEHELSYRLCTRTVDGDIDWDDYEYELISPALRIDFGGRSVELPFNLTRNDSWSKGFEARTHLDGTTVGYWDEAVSRTASFTTDIMRIDTDRADAVRDLATYPGACFVRTPDGCAFQANVDVNGLDRRFGDLSIAVSITANEVALTDEYRIPPEGWDG